MMIALLLFLFTIHHAVYYVSIRVLKCKTLSLSIKLKCFMTQVLIKAQRLMFHKDDLPKCPDDMIVTYLIEIILVMRTNFIEHDEPSLCQ